jgi:transposase
MRCWQVPALVMEAPDYWKPVLYRLEAGGFECVLADARQVKNLPGRPKRDPSDSSWLAQCFERGSVRPCFVADPEFRIIRLHTRYRRDLTEDRTREKNRAEKLLESGLLTELPDVTTAQKAELPWRHATTLTEMSRSAGRTGRDLDLGATESGHTALNSSPAFSSLLLVSISPTWR